MLLVATQRDCRIRFLQPNLLSQSSDLESKVTHFNSAFALATCSSQREDPFKVRSAQRKKFLLKLFQICQLISRRSLPLIRLTMAA